ncbi:UDP-N-acetylmuramate dehydrogenase [Phytohalomonas tamaricis]|uniref:UDP-N-acetylmuramate dehydrogenase n=1 Tax=Phytohalomonas tamaricis TaxID=2081032 RepID=UPI000D0BE416|nr:UDP-N-acetylmuramate dehydrogenase [Phytohalomonas tamaricis]
MRVRHNVALTDANTLGFSALASRYVEVATLDEACQALALARRYCWPLTVLGGGSNVIMQHYLSGLVLRPVGQARWIEALDDKRALLHVEAGVPWHTLVVELAQAGWWGTENLALIPGCTGAAPIQNIGAYGVELADVLEAVHIVHLEDGRYEILTREACCFGYRDSIFKHALQDRVVIVRVVLRLEREPKPRLEYGGLSQRVPVKPIPIDIVDAICALRREKLPDPAVLGNVGSFFKNPVVAESLASRLYQSYPDMPIYPTVTGDAKLAAGWLIERCGFKGYREQHVGVHDRQALVLVHHGGGNARELLDLAERIKLAVYECFGVMLEPEPRVIGNEGH